MGRLSNREVLTGIQNGEKAVLVYLSEKYFQHARRNIRIKGFSDQVAPGLFSSVLIKAWLSFQRMKFPAGIDFETYFFHSLDEYLVTEKKKRQPEKGNSGFPEEEKIKVIAQCVSILDQTSRELVQASCAEQLNFEQIAERFGYSNSVIAEHEVMKAMNQLEEIVKVRFNLSNN